MRRTGVWLARYAAWPLCGLAVVYWLAAALIELNLVSRSLLIFHGTTTSRVAAVPVWLVVTVGWPIFLPLGLGLSTWWLRPRALRAVAVVVVAAAAGLLHQLYWFLLLYHWRNGLTFDLAFFWYNRTDAAATVIRSFPLTSLAVFLLLFPLLGAFWFGLPWTMARYLGFRGGRVLVVVCLLLAVSGLGVFGSHLEFQGEMARFLRQTFNRGRVTYVSAYQEHLAELWTAGEFRPPPTPAVLPSRIVLVQIEGVSSSLVHPSTTPSLLAFARQGVLFPHFYSNAVQTVRSQESALCGLPPSIAGTLAMVYAPDRLSRLPCLPRLMAALGYRTVFLQNDGFGFSHQGEFLRAIGFSELHADDLAHPGDPRLPWGYREDVFFRRAADFLEALPDQRVFAVVAVSASNHFPWPTVTDPALRDHLPYPIPETFRQQVANTTFAQDAYLGTFLGRLQTSVRPPAVFVYGDNGIQLDRPGTLASVEYDNREGSYLTFLLALPPIATPEFARGRLVSERYSQMDLLPTLAELAGTTAPAGLLGRSFAAQLFAAPPPTAAASIIMVQPFSRPRLSVVYYPAKYVVDFSTQYLYRFDLQHDPGESSPALLGGGAAVRQFLFAVFQNSRRDPGAALPEDRRAGLLP